MSGAADAAPGGPDGAATSGAVTSRAAISEAIGDDPVKMVVWDLDDTLWSGTLSEGPVALDPSRVELVRTLNRRGIVNSICSKNDRDDVRRRLEQVGLWGEFVFASVEWTPKGARVAAIIDDAQLRAENILMVDDSPLNREEIRHAAPGVRTAGPEIIDELLSLPGLAGKDDRELSRLRQYQVLERKVTDRRGAPSGHEDFLRSCDIRVALFEGADAAEETDRLFELVHRTNQLNFTKRRPSADEFSDLLADPARRAGYVRARDRYGDYGICGFFSLSEDGTTLVDFLFSCRVLHMGVEQWVFDSLDRPALAVAGEVASSVVRSGASPVDWIVCDPGAFADGADAGPGADGLATGSAPAPAAGTSPGGSRVLMVGGCDLIAVAQFLGGDIQTDFSRNGPTGELVHIEHTELLRQAARGVSEEQLAVVDRLLFMDREVFRPAALHADYDVLVYSVLMDYTQGLYRHRGTGLVVPWYQLDRDATDPACWPAIEEKFGRFAVDEEFLGWFSQEFEHLEPQSPERFQDNVRWMARDVCRGARLVLINGAELAIDQPREPDRHLRHRQMNAALDEVVAELPGAVVCDIRAVVTSEDDLSKEDLRHYHRHVYKAIAELIEATGAADVTVRTTPPPGEEERGGRIARHGRRVRRAGARLIGALRPSPR